MPKRYCGRWIIDVKYEDRWDQYACAINHDTDVVPGRGRIPPKMVHVKPPVHLTQAVDSPQAYDDAAHAALSFATHDNLIGDEELDFTDKGFRIRRRH